MEGVNEYRRQCTAIVQYTVFESTAILYPASPHIIGLYKSFPSLVIDEIKCYKGRGGGGGGGGHFTPEGDSLPQCRLSGGTLCTSAKCSGGAGGGGGLILGGTLYTTTPA